MVFKSTRSQKFYKIGVLKVNKSQYIALFVVSGSIKKLDCLNIYFSRLTLHYLFSIFLSIVLKVWGYPTFIIS